MLIQYREKSLNKFILPKNNTTVKVGLSDEENKFVLVGLAAFTASVSYGIYNVVKGNKITGVVFILLSFPIGVYSAILPAYVAKKI